MTNPNNLPAHSPIGASSMDRWSICPGSVRLSVGIPKKTSVYAEEGTLAHDIAAKILEQTGQFNLEDREMHEAIAVYVTEVREKAKDADAFLVEHRFDLSKIHNGLYGTADAVIFNTKESTLYVYDFKYGAGIPVEVERNQQLMYYGLGALLSTGFLCRDVELVIVQPRCFHSDGPIRRWRFPSVELLDFAADLKAAALRTEDPNAPLVPGDHCGFCPASSVCPALHAKALAVAKEEFSPSFSYDENKLAKTLEWLPVLEDWIKNVREFAYREAQHGRIPPGFKLVNKVARRKWRDPEQAMQTALANKQLGLVETCIKSITECEKVLGKKGFNEMFAEAVVSESSGLTLVHNSDKRPAHDPKTQFTKVETTEQVIDLLK